MRKNNMFVFIVIVSIFLTSFALADELKDQQLADLQKRLTDILKNSVSPQEAQARLARLDLYQKNNPEKPLIRGIEGKVFECDNAPVASSSFYGASKIKRVLLLVNKTLYANATAKEKIDRYIKDVQSAHACTVILETLEGGKPPEIKAIIKNHYTNGGLDGAVQIGKLPEPWYESDNDPTTGKYDKFTCDLYYMDLDGDWTDANNNGMFDGHVKGSGTLGIEIFYGRIDCTTMSTYGTEVALLTEYMDKLHNYYLGKIELNKAALGYLDHDWSSSANYLDQIFPGSSGNELIRWAETNPPVNKSDYLTNRLQKNYTALQMWCHAGFDCHAHNTGGASTREEVYKANPKPIAYFHDGCHVSDFAGGGGKSFLGGCYVFNKSPTSLLCMSGSRSGQWIGLMAKVMFQELGKNTCVGQAFKIWFAPYENSSEESDKQNFIGWNYGYNIFGDPLITLVSRPATGVTTTEHAGKSGTLQCVITKDNLLMSYTLTKQATISVSLFDMSGRKLYSSTREMQDIGSHTIVLKTTQFPSGSYIVVLKSSALNYSRWINIIK